MGKHARLLALSILNLFAVGLSSAAADCQVCASSMAQIERHYTDWNTFEQFKESFINIPGVDERVSMFALIENDPMLRRAHFYDYMIEKRQYLNYGRMLAEVKSSRDVIDSVRQRRENAERVVDLLTTFDPFDIIFGQIKDTTFDTVEQAQLMFELRELDNDMRERARSYAEEDLVPYGAAIETFQQRLDDLQRIKSSKPEDAQGLEKIAKDIGEFRSPYEIQENLKSGVYGRRANSKDNLINSYMDVIVKMRAYAQATQETISALQRLGVDVPEDVIATVRYASAAASIGELFATRPWQLASLQSISILGSLGSNTPSTEVLILGQLMVIDKKLDQVLEGQKRILENQVIINRKLDLISEQISVGNATILFEIRDSTKFVLDALFRNEWQGLRACQHIGRLIRTEMTKQDLHEGPLSAYESILSGPERKHADECFDNGLGKVLALTSSGDNDTASVFYKMYGSLNDDQLYSFIDVNTDAINQRILLSTGDFIDSIYNPIAAYWTENVEKYAITKEPIGKRVRLGQIYTAALIPSLKLSENLSIRQIAELSIEDTVAAQDLSIAYMTSPLADESVSQAIAAIGAVHSFLHFTSSEGGVYTYASPSTVDDCSVLRRMFNQCSELGSASTSMSKMADEYVAEAERLARIGLAQNSLIDGRAILPFIFQDIRTGDQHAIQVVEGLFANNRLLKANFERKLVADILKASGGSWRTFAMQTADGDVNRIAKKLNEGAEHFFDSSGMLTFSVFCENDRNRKFCTDENNPSTTLDLAFELKLTSTKDNSATYRFDTTFRLPTWRDLRKGTFLTYTGYENKLRDFFAIAHIADQYRLTAADVAAWEKELPSDARLNKQDAWLAYLTISTVNAISE